MKVKYIVRDIELKLKTGLSPNEEKYYNGWSILPSKFHLTFEKGYVVYGIEFDKNGYINFLIVDDTEVDYPKSYPSEFFEIIDSKISKYWGIKDKNFPIHPTAWPVLIFFKEAMDRYYFFDDLIECKNGAQELFLAYKKLMDLEFLDDKLKTAEALEMNWIVCAYCNEVWNNYSDNGILECPKCGKYNNNPFHSVNSL